SRGSARSGVKYKAFSAFVFGCQIRPVLGKTCIKDEHLSRKRCRLGEKMKAVRPFVKSDIPQVVGLFQKVFFNNGQAAPSSSKLSAYFEEFFFHSPWVEEEGGEKGGAEEGITSLVYETDHGEIIGFIGVTPRRMVLRGQPIRAAVSMHFMVEPGSRST